MATTKLIHQFQPVALVGPNAGASHKTAVHRRKLLLVGTNDAVGAKHQMQQLARGMALRGFEVHIAFGIHRRRKYCNVIADAPTRLTGVPNIHLSHFDLSATGAAKLHNAGSALKVYEKRNGPFQVVHGHGLWGGKVVKKAAVRGGPPRIYSGHEIDDVFYRSMSTARLSYRRQLKSICTAVDAVICSSVHHSELFAKLRVPARKLKIVPTGTEVPRPIDPFTARSELALQESEFCFGYIGPLTSTNGADFLLQTFARLASIHPRARLLIAGNGPDRTQLITASKGLDCASSVIWQKPIELDRSMAALDAFVLPAGGQGLAYNLLSAAGRGLPIIMANRGGAREFEELGAATTFDAYDANGLLEAMQRLCDNPALRERLSKNALLAANQYQLNHMIDGVEELYNELAGVA